MYMCWAVSPSTGRSAPGKDNKMPNLTPGPWILEATRPGTGPWQKWRILSDPQISGASREVIAIVNGLHKARLIVATPDLLRAIKLTLRMFERDQASGNFQGDEEHEAWSALAAAVAKAEG